MEDEVRVELQPEQIKHVSIIEVLHDNKKFIYKKDIVLLQLETDATSFEHIARVDSLEEDGLSASDLQTYFETAIVVDGLEGGNAEGRGVVDNEFDQLYLTGVDDGPIVMVIDKVFENDVLIFE